MSEWLGFAGLVVSVLGFGITLWQLSRTKSAADAATGALEDATNRLNSNHLLVILPQMRNLEHDLDTATEDNDKKHAIRTLVSYSQTATQLASLLEENEDGDRPELVAELRSCARLATSTKASLVTGPPRPVKSVVGDISEQISSISGPLAGLIAKYQTKVN